MRAGSAENWYEVRVFNDGFANKKTLHLEGFLA
jgi:hypothetical protein